MKRAFEQSGGKTPRWRLGVAVLAAALAVPSLWAEGLSTQKLQALLSANNTKGGGGSDWTIAWSLDGEWQKPGRKMNLDLTIDSDYSRSDSAELDRLRTGWRFIANDYGAERYRWYPLFLIQTEGDHAADSVHTLGAFGYRQKRKYGFFELTAGVSKDVRSSEQWVGDVGFQLAYERRFGPKWKFRTGPKGEMGALGEVRLRGDRLRYSWDVALDYAASETMSLGYKFWTGNTVPNSERTQWLGVSFKWK